MTQLLKLVQSEDGLRAELCKGIFEQQRKQLTSAVDALFDEVACKLGVIGANNDWDAERYERVAATVKHALIADVLRCDLEAKMPTLGDEIGRGANGVIYQVADDPAFVIKKVPCANDSQLLRIANEVFILRHMSSKGVSPKYSGTHADADPPADLLRWLESDQGPECSLYIKIERFDGNGMAYLTSLLSEAAQSAEQLNRLHKPILALALASIRALKVLHQSGFVHRDFKLDAMLVSWRNVAEPRAVIGDFGVSTTAGISQTTSPGAPITWAPEQLVGGTFSTAKSDVYAAGIVLWQLANLGALPPNFVEAFKNGRQSFADLVLRGQRPPLAHLSGPLSEICQACWKPTPEERWSMTTVDTHARTHASSLFPAAKLQSQFNQHGNSALMNTPMSTRSASLLATRVSELFETAEYQE